MRNYIDPATSFELETKLGKITAKTIEADQIYVDFNSMIVNSVEGIKGNLRLTKYDKEFELSCDVYNGHRTKDSYHALYATRGFLADVSDAAKKKIRSVLTDAVNEAVKNGTIPAVAFKQAQAAQLNNAIMRVETKLDEKQKEVSVLDDELRELLMEEAALGTSLSARLEAD